MQASTAQICKLYIYLYLPLHDMIDIPPFLIDRMVFPQNPLFGLSTSPSPPIFIFFPVSQPLIAILHPTYSQSVFFFVSAFVSFAPTDSTILLLARQPADISTILVYHLLFQVPSSSCLRVDSVACISCSSHTSILHTTCFLNFGLPPSIFSTFPSTRVPYARYVYYSTVNGLMLLDRQ